MGEAALKDIFISYNRADEAWAQALAERIEQEPRDDSNAAPKLSAFFAPWDIEFGENIPNRINDGLRRARFFAPVMSPEFFASGWTNLEWTDQVSLDPRNAQGRILPLLHRDISTDGKDRIVIPAPFNVLNRLDFREGHDFDAAFEELVRILRGQPKRRGASGARSVLAPRVAQSSATAHEYAFPSAVPELLIGNLLELRRMPELIWSGETDAREPLEVYKLTSTKEPFILKDKKIYSFAYSGDPLCSLHPALKAGARVTSFRCEEWLHNEDQPSLTRLLNRCVGEHAYERNLRRDDKGRYYFRPYYATNDPEPLTREHRFPDEPKPRAVAARKVNPKDNSVFWVHYAAKLKIEFLEARAFLRIEPTFVFTQDGREPIGGTNAGRLAIQWTGQQRNPDVLRTMLFWTRYLADGKSQIRIPAGAAELEFPAVPTIVRTNFGISGDYIRMAALMADPVDILDEVAASVEAVETVAEDVDNELT